MGRGWPDRRFPEGEVRLLGLAAVSAWRVQPWLPGALPRASAADGAVGVRRLLHNVCESDVKKASRTSVAHVCVVLFFRACVCVFPCPVSRPVVASSVCCVVRWSQDPSMAQALSPVVVMS